MNERKTKYEISALFMSIAVILTTIVGTAANVETVNMKNSGKPDLIIKELWGEHAPVLGPGVHFCCKVKNIGTGEAKPIQDESWTVVKVEYDRAITKDDHRIVYKDFKPPNHIIQPGQTTEKIGTIYPVYPRGIIPFFIIPTTYKVTATVDPNNVIDEINEENNVKTSYISVDLWDAETVSNIRSKGRYIKWFYK